MHDRWSDIREGQMSSEAEASLIADVRLSEWPTLHGDYVLNACDGTGAWFRFADEQIRITALCNNTDTSESVLWLRDVVKNHLTALWDGGAAVTGPARYVLVSDPGSIWSSSVTDSAAVWPLGIPASSAAISLDDASAYEPGTSKLASAGADADALRVIRRNFVGAGKLPLTGGFLPVLGDDGAHYQLFVRDSIPLEDASGLLHVF
jgi:hypothetical protein